MSGRTAALTRQLRAVQPPPRPEEASARGPGREDPGRASPERPLEHLWPRGRGGGCGPRSAGGGGAGQEGGSDRAPPTPAGGRRRRAARGRGRTRGRGLSRALSHVSPVPRPAPGPVFIIWDSRRNRPCSAACHRRPGHGKEPPAGDSRSHPAAWETPRRGSRRQRAEEAEGTALLAPARAGAERGAEWPRAPGWHRTGGKEANAPGFCGSDARRPDSWGPRGWGRGACPGTPRAAGRVICPLCGPGSFLESPSLIQLPFCRSPPDGDLGVRRVWGVPTLSRPLWPPPARSLPPPLCARTRSSSPTWAPCPGAWAYRPSHSPEPQVTRGSWAPGPGLRGAGVVGVTALPPRQRWAVSGSEGGSAITAGWGGWRRRVGAGAGLGAAGGAAPQETSAVRVAVVSGILGGCAPPGRESPCEIEETPLPARRGSS